MPSLAQVCGVGKTRYTTAMMAAHPPYAGEFESDLWPINGFSGLWVSNLEPGQISNAWLSLWLSNASLPASLPKPARVSFIPDQRKILGSAAGADPRCCGGDGWESNPPGTAQHRPTDGFEDRCTGAPG